MRCLTCGSESVEKVSLSCAEAVEVGKGFQTVDYYGDGSKFVPIGVHFDEWRCVACGDTDAEPCIHD